MAAPELIAETNRLLRELLDKDAEQRAQSAETIAKLEERHKAVETQTEERRKDSLREQGLPEEAVEGSDEEWEARRKLAQQRSQERLEAARKKDEAYRDALLQELRTQSDLLRRIADRLER